MTLCGPSCKFEPGGEKEGAESDIGNHSTSKCHHVMIMMTMMLKVIIGPFEGHIDFVKPGLHHATELGVQANQVVCESRFLMFFF